MENKLWEEIKRILSGIDKVENDNKQDEEDDGWWETSAGASFGKKKLEEIKSAVESYYPTYFMVADNSDAFRSFLDSKKIPYVANGHFTGIPFERNDIFKIGMEWGVFKYVNKTAQMHKKMLGGNHYGQDTGADNTGGLF